jgi:phosphodiesterase/alkaline phosphatase D-like protein
MLFLSNDDAKYIVYFKKNVNDMRSCKKHVGMKAVKMADDSTVDIVLHNGDTIHFETPNAKKLYVLLNSF